MVKETVFLYWSLIFNNIITIPRNNTNLLTLNNSDYDKEIKTT
jgi:hypothetical protein